MTFFLESEPGLLDWLTVGSAVFTAFIALVALLFAWRQVREARKSREQVQAAEIERSQPYVVAYMEPAVALFVQELVIKNFGQTAAYNIKIEISPKPQHSGSMSGGVVMDLKLPEIIPFLAPGQEWRTLWDRPAERDQEKDLHDRHDVSVSYQGLEGKELHSSAVLDWALLRVRRHFKVRGIHDLATAAEAIRDNQASWTDREGGISATTYSGESRDKKNADMHRKAREEDALEPPPKKRAKPKDASSEESKDQETETDQP